MAEVASLFVSLGLKNNQYMKGLRQSQSAAKTVTAKIQSGLNKLNFRNFLYGSVGIYAVQRGLRSTMKPAADLEAQLAQVSTMLNESSMKHMSAYKSGLQDIAIEMGESTESLSRGLYDILSASIDASKAIDVLRVASKAATAGLTTTAVSADAITTILNSYQLEAEEASRVSDLLFAAVKRGKITFDQIAGSIGMVASTAGQAKLPLEEMMAAIATMTRSGVRAELAVVSLNGILRTFMKPTAEAQKIAKKFGIELNLATIQAMGLSGVLERLQSLPPEAISRLFPDIRGLRGLNALLGDYQGFLQDIDIAAKSAGMTQEAFAKQTQTLNFRLGQLRQLATRLFVEFGDEFIPQLKEAADNIIAWHKANKEFVSGKIVEYAEKLKKAFIAIFNAVNDNKEKIVSTLKTMVAVKIISGFASLATNIYSVAKAVGALSLALATNPFGAVALGVGAVASGLALAGSVGTKSKQQEAEITHIGQQSTSFNNTLTITAQDTGRMIANIIGQSIYDSMAIPQGYTAATKTRRSVNRAGAGGIRPFGTGQGLTLDKPFDPMSGAATTPDMIQSQMKLGAAIDNTKKKMQDFVNSANSNIKTINQGWLRFADTFSYTMASAASQAGNTFANIKNAFTSMLKGMVAEMAARAAIFSLFNMFTGGGFGAAQGGLANFLGFGQMSYSGKAAGGRVRAGQPYMIGERGAEMFVPQSSGKIVPNNQTNDNSNWTINFYGNPCDLLDGESIVEALREAYRNKQLNIAEFA